MEDEEEVIRWNHRVIRTKDGDEYFFEFHECYYSGEEKIPHLWTQDSTCVGAESMEALSWVLDQMKKALSKPVLEIVDNKLREV